MALPILDGPSTLAVVNGYVSKPYVEMTLDVLAQFGIVIERRSENDFKIPGRQQYHSETFVVENDFSQAAFWIVAGILCGNIEIQGLNQFSLQGDRKIIEIVQEMGAEVSWEGTLLKIKQSTVHNIDIDASMVPDLVPILTLLGALSKGTMRISGIGRLSAKESDRAQAITTELKKMGADIILEKDRLIIAGVSGLKGAEVDSWMDHRIAMTLAIAAATALGETRIENSDAVNKSYPEFLKHYTELGGEVIG
jgi:3-phosphoshikimate 1-carboxyvinyltransferase